MTISPPGPMLQNVNAVLHREPFTSISYGLYWTLLFVFCIPTVVIFLQLQLIWRILTWCIGRSSISPTFDPKAKPDYDMAVVISGCDTGFGKDLAINAANSGYTVFAGCYRHSTSKHQFESSSNIISFQLDVTSDNDTNAAAELVQKWLTESSMSMENIGRKRILHALVNNAGIGSFAHTDWSDISVFQAIMDVNFFGTVRMVKSFLPLFKDQAIAAKAYCGMRVINVVSVAGFVSGLPGGNGYCSSKHALQSYTESLRIELLPFEIAVTSVNPTFHSTPLVTEFGKVSFDQLPQTAQAQYGRTFVENVQKKLDFLFHVCQWNSVIVVDQVMDLCLKSCYPPRQLVIGSDARFLIMAIARIVPPNIREPIMIYLFRKTTPTCMLVNKTTNE